MKQNITQAERCTPRPTKAGWRINEFMTDTGLSRSSVYNLVKAGKVEAVKAGKVTIIVTSPEKFIASLRGEAA
jgi:hypothetical protein